ncbi:hypothetical protein AWJ20_4497 [Sugiyamaella lignohabitans]|uniref:WLM domain-containing protein n=1 Tax=Sugiyamaella lignohabitans TaxID=796027 RepID=A0A167CGW1_9ASCO|nr:uncharacterized protein AWJ20_4497 [Sugiyamaella lignohabitans]ANB11676.1 hypothetical protein AWJ20_4497 [Sugiyamaella lignohabitans]
MTVLTISFKGESRELNIDDALPYSEFLQEIEKETQIPAEFVKLITAGLGVIKADKLANGGATPISKVFHTEQSRKKIILMGTPINKMEELQETEAAKAREHARYLQRSQNLRRLARRPARTQSAVPSSTYTFHKIEPLAGLPHPEKARAYLERLRDDRGIRAIMEKYKWSVGVLSELDPASSTSHQSRLLGLNTGMGQMIQLRIRTDDYQGFCNYKEVRKVLCHELTHNVHSEHDRKFWDLCKILEREAVDLDPFGHSGRQLGPDIYDGPGFGADLDELLAVDEGGLIGSTQRLGTLEPPSTSTSHSRSKPTSTITSSPTSTSTATTTNSSPLVPSTTTESTPTSPPTDEDDSVQARIRRAAEERRRHNKQTHEESQAGN